MQKSFFALLCHYSLNKWENYHPRRNMWQKAEGKETKIWMTPRAFDNTAAVRTHSEAVEWVRPAGVFIIGHNANVLPCQLYHFTAQNGTSVNTRGFYIKTRWKYEGRVLLMCRTNWRVTYWMLVLNPAATKSQLLHLTSRLTILK